MTRPAPSISPSAIRRRRSSRACTPRSRSPPKIYKDRLLVPQEAILVRGGRKLVFVVENGLAKWSYVKIGLENEHFAEILAGERPEETVNEGDLVIIEGHFTLAHDASVTIKE